MQKYLPLILVMAAVLYLANVSPISTIGDRRYNILTDHDNLDHHHCKKSNISMMNVNKKTIVSYSYQTFVSSNFALKYQKQQPVFFRTSFAPKDRWIQYTMIGQIKTLITDRLLPQRQTVRQTRYYLKNTIMKYWEKWKGDLMMIYCLCTHVHCTVHWN